MTQPVLNSIDFLLYIIVSLTILKYNVASPVKSSEENLEIIHTAEYQNFEEVKISKTEVDISEEKYETIDGYRSDEASGDDKGLNKIEPLRPPVCGYISPVFVPRVLGGSSAEIGRWPWIAALIYGDSNATTVVCGASLISSQHLLTAAHCFDGDDISSIVRLGEYDVNDDEDSAFDCSIEQITIHPEYDNDTLENDIAILKLTTKIDLTDDVHPICLPVDDAIKNYNFEDNYLSTAGWGDTSYNGSSSDILRQVELPVVNEEACYNASRRLDLEFVVDNRVICAGYDEGGEDACQGDSGGPLVFSKNLNYYLIGIVSGGYQCGVPDSPGIYTRVSSFLDFILINMN